VNKADSRQREPAASLFSYDPTKLDGIRTFFFQTFARLEEIDYFCGMNDNRNVTKIDEKKLARLKTGAQHFDEKFANCNSSLLCEGME